jgi:hypothetical protein
VVAGFGIHHYTPSAAYFPARLLTPGRHSRPRGNILLVGDGWRTCTHCHTQCPKRTLDCYRLSRHAIMYKGDLRTSSTAVLDMPMSASSRSSSSRSCLYWFRRSDPSAIPASHAIGIFQDHLRCGNKDEAGLRVLVLPRDMFHLRNGGKQRLAAGAHRVVVKGPSDFSITPVLCVQAIVSGQAEGCQFIG